jgi:hypothetical protein
MPEAAMAAMLLPALPAPAAVKVARVFSAHELANIPEHVDMQLSRNEAATILVDISLYEEGWIIATRGA